MTDEKALDKINNRQMYVAKGNDLIQKGRFSLSLIEQKLVLFIISKIKPNDSPLTEYEFEIVDFCNACDIDKHKMYADEFLATLRKLGERIIEIRKNDGAILIGHWFSNIEISPDQKHMKVCFDYKIRSQLFDLISCKQGYTQYRFEQICGMQSKYSIRLYELLLSYARVQRSVSIELSIDEIRAGTDSINKYPEYRELKRNVITPAMKEINNTDLHVTATPIKQGRFVSAIKFEIVRVDDNLPTF